MFRSFFFPESSMRGAGIPEETPGVSLNPVSRSCRFLILGGGIHGTYIANLLIREAGIPAAAVTIVDRHGSLLGEWRRVTAATGMTHLRSTSVHHLDPDPVSLRRFQTRNSREYPDAYAAPYNRPSLRLFNDHALLSAERSGAAERCVGARCLRVEVLDGGFRLKTDRGDLDGDNLILAVGQGTPRIPLWTSQLDDRFPVVHLFSEEFDPVEWREAAAKGVPVKMLGAGISALQAAVSIAGGTAAPVEVFSVHRTRSRQFDSDPGWIGPRFLSRFAALSDPAQRRRLLTEARFPGSGDPATVKRFEALRAEGRIRFRTLGEEEIAAAVSGALIEDGGRLLLATGYEPRSPGGALTDPLAAAMELPFAPCGYPVVNRYLAWGRGLFVSGALAELELGPVARNISGARRAGERLYRLLADSKEGGTL
jgi:cation diffusion facilitator CzcD-associated flavoprotein CzcO